MRDNLVFFSVLVSELLKHKQARLGLITTRGRALTQLIEVLSHCVIARRLGLSQSTISLHKRVRYTESTNDRPRSGKSRDTTLRENSAIRLGHLGDKSRTAVQSANLSLKELVKKNPLEIGYGISALDPGDHTQDVR